MKFKLKKEEEKSLLENIRRVLETGKNWEKKNLHYPADAIINTVLKIPGVKKPAKVGDLWYEGFETNGWELDWWQKFTFKGKDYTLRGSGYYGGHAFHVADE